ncbi:MAG: porin family protein [Blastocatellia bacterium]|nr:porin family protein [Blastocatellia bacterium]
MAKLFISACCLVLVCFSNAFAQKNEMGFLLGGGKLSDKGDSVGSFAFTISYTRSIVWGLAVEGSVDIFSAKTSPTYRDSFEAGQIAAVYNFPSLGKDRIITPYVSAGAGRVSTDFLDIPGEAIYRFGGGVKYYFKDESPFGIRVEVRDEITRKGRQPYPLQGPRVSLVSVRAGLTWRF